MRLFLDSLCNMQPLILPVGGCDHDLVRFDFLETNV